MNKPKLSCFEEQDVLHLVLAEGEEANSVELTPNLRAAINENGGLIGT